MSEAPLPPRGPLWAQVGEDDAETLPLWKAALAAVALELLVPFLVFGVDWSFLPSWRQTPTPVMSVRLDQPPPEPAPPPAEEKPKRKPKEKKLDQVAIELPKPLPDERPAKIVLPKPEPKPKPKPDAEPPPEDKPPEPEPEPEVPPLPSVFRDVKPVKKVKPIYPREAEDAHIQGRVRVRLSVDLEGNVTEVQMLLSEPPGVFDEAVLTAVKQYRFKKDGTTYQADQEIVFKLDD